MNISTEGSHPLGEEPVFSDRFEAGRALAECLTDYQGRPDTLVLGIARGGVPVAYEVARQLSVPLAMINVRKIGLPGHPEYAVGAVASGEMVLLDQEPVSGSELERAVQQAQRELADQDRRLGQGEMPRLEGKTVLVVDDGLARGATMTAAVQSLRQRHPAQIVVACPVGSREAVENLSRRADHVVCASVPHFFRAVGQWYEDFSQVSDDTVRDLLARGRVG